MNDDRYAEGLRDARMVVQVFLEQWLDIEGKLRAERRYDEALAFSQRVMTCRTLVEAIDALPK